MEKNSANLLNLINLPIEIQQEIAAYLNITTLGFFAKSSKQTFNTILPLLIKYQVKFRLLLTSRWNNTYLYQANQLFVCGANPWGQLGLGDKENRITFTAVPWPAERSSIKQVIPGLHHTVVLTQANHLWMCGDNCFGELGLGDKNNRITFTAVPWPEARGKIEQVLCGLDQTVVLTDANKLWACGYNEWGQLGLGDKEHRSTFTEVPWPEAIGKIEQVLCGMGQTVVLTDANKLWACGYNEWGQLGLGDNVNRSTFTSVPWSKSRGRIQQVIAGENHTIVLTEDNRLWVCGNNEWGQLGLGDKEHRYTFTVVPWPAERGRIQQVIPGAHHTVVLTQANQLWVCGSNRYGQLGLGDQKHRSTFTLVPWPVERGRIEQVTVGGAHVVILTKNNGLWVCGYNEWNQLGLGDKEHLATLCGYEEWGQLKNYLSTFTPIEKISEAMKQAFETNNNLNQLIKIGTTLTSNTEVVTETLHNQCPPNELDDQLSLK